MRLFGNLKARILKSIITWSVMGQQNAQAKKVYSLYVFNNIITPLAFVGYEIVTGYLPSHIQRALDSKLEC